MSSAAASGGDIPREERLVDLNVLRDALKPVWDGRENEDDADIVAGRIRDAAAAVGRWAGGSWKSVWGWVVSSLASGGSSGPGDDATRVRRMSEFLARHGVLNDVNDLLAAVHDDDDDPEPARSAPPEDLAVRIMAPAGNLDGLVRTALDLAGVLADIAGRAGGPMHRPRNTDGSFAADHDIAARARSAADALREFGGDDRRIAWMFALASTSADDGGGTIIITRFLRRHGIDYLGDGA